MARAASLYAACRYAEAAGCYRAVLSIDASDHRAYLGLADCAVGQGRREDAIEELVGAAADFRDREDYDGAFALLARALAIDPERLEVHIDVAELEAASGRIEMAIGRLENLARAYEQSRQYEEAAAIHEVIGAWTAEEPAEPELETKIPPMDPGTLVAEAVPISVVPGMTQPAYVGVPDEPRREPPPPPPAPPPRQLVVETPMMGSPRPMTTAITESVLLRKVPPPPPPPRVIRTQVDTRAPAQSVRQTQSAPVQASPEAPQPVRRGRSRDRVAPRWRPSTVQGTPEVAQRQSSAPAKPAQAKDKPRRKSVVEPAPSPKRGAIKLDRLPALKGPVQPRKPSAGIPRRTPSKHTALLHPNLSKPMPSTQATPPAPLPVVAKLSLDKRSMPLSTRPVSERRPSAPKPHRPQPPKSSLADRLRRASAGPNAPVSVEIDADDEPTRLWAPDHLLL